MLVRYLWIFKLCVFFVLAPGKPVITDMKSVNTSCIQLLWREPNEQNGVIVKYQVKVIEVDTPAVFYPTLRDDFIHRI